MHKEFKITTGTTKQREQTKPLDATPENMPGFPSFSSFHLKIQVIPDGGKGLFCMDISEDWLTFKERMAKSQLKASFI